MCRTARSKELLCPARTSRSFSSFSCASAGSLTPSAPARGERACPACGSDHPPVPAAPLPWRSSTAWPLRCPSSWNTAESTVSVGRTDLPYRDTTRNISSLLPQGGAGAAASRTCSLQLRGTTETEAGSSQTLRGGAFLGGWNALSCHHHPGGHYKPTASHNAQLRTNNAALLFPTQRTGTISVERLLLAASQYTHLPHVVR